MGELAGINDPTGVPVYPSPGQWPPPYPGMPRGLEQLSAREQEWWGNVFSVDTPYAWTPSGWGEQVILLGDYSDVDPAAVILGRNGPLK